MSFSPEQSAIKMTPELTEKVANAPNAEAIKNIMFLAAVEQHLIKPDSFDTRGDDRYSYTPVERPATNGFAKTLVVGDKKYVLESQTEEGLVAEELKVMRQIFAQPAASAPSRDAAGRFVSAEEQSRAAHTAQAAEAQRELDAIAARVAAASVDPAAEAEAAIVRRSLAAQGIDVDALRQYTEEKQAQNYQSAWQAAGEQFQKEHPDWAGGDNFDTLMRVIQENPELMNNPSAETIARAWTHMKENNLVVEDAADVEARELSEAKTPEDLAAVLRSRNRIAPLGTNLWGR